MRFLSLLMKPFNLLLRALRFKKKRDEESAAGEAQGREPVRIALLGHTATGKTVFYAMLYHQLRKDPELQMSATTQQTGAYLHERINMLLGLEDAEDEYGRRISRKVTPRWPEGTVDGGTLEFSIRPSRGETIPLQMVEYAGESIGLHSIDMLTPEAREFFLKADCVFFMLDAEMRDAEVEMEARLESLQILLSAIAGHRDRAAIPLAFIVSKADRLPGFEHEEQVALIPPTVPVTRRVDFERLRTAILESEIVNREPVWKAEVERVLDSTARLIRVVLHHADRFQVFFVSSIGKPEVVLDDVGVRRQLPPKQIKSIGLVEPLRWWARIHRLRASEQRARRFAKVAGILAILFILGAAAWHFPHRAKVHRMLATWEESGDPCEAQLSYRNSRWMRWTHPRFWAGLGGGSFRWSESQRGWTCVTPPIECGAYVARRLGEAGCVPERLRTFDDVRRFCEEAVQPLVDLLRARDQAAAAGEPVPDPPQEADLQASCWSRFGPEIERRVASDRSGVRQDVKQKMDGLLRALMGPDLAGAGASDPEPVGAVFAAAEYLVGPAVAEGSPPAEGGAELVRMLLGETELELARGLRDLAGPARAAACEPGAVLRLSEQVRAMRVMALPKQMEPIDEGLLAIAGWFEQRSFYCLETGPCVNLANAQQAGVESCLQKVQNYLEQSSPPQLLRARAGQLSKQANDRLAQLARTAQEQTLEQIAVQTGGGAAAGGGAGQQAGRQGGGNGGTPAPATPAAGSGSPAAPARTSGQAEQIAEASRAWKSVRFELLGFSVQDRAVVDHLYYRWGPDERWQDNSLWPMKSMSSFCMRENATLHLAVSSTQNERSNRIDARFPGTWRWSDVVSVLRDKGVPVQGGNVQVDSHGLAFENGVVVAEFRLEASESACP